MGRRPCVPLHSSLFSWPCLSDMTCLLLVCSYMAFSLCPLLPARIFLPRPVLYHPFRWPLSGTCSSLVLALWKCGSLLVLQAARPSTCWRAAKSVLYPALYLVSPKVTQLPVFKTYWEVLLLQERHAGESMRRAKETLGRMQTLP